MKWILRIGYVSLLFVMVYAIVMDWALLAACAAFTLGTNVVIDMTEWARRKAAK